MPNLVETLTVPDADRFWLYVDVRGEDECWPWLGGRFKTGKRYGAFGVRGRAYKSHRIAYFLYRGLELMRNGCHSCDSATCCNPKHIFDGSQQDNISDMVSKGRSNHSARRPKIEPKDAEFIRNEYNSGRSTQAALAKRFEIHPSTVSNIIAGRSWKES